MDHGRRPAGCLNQSRKIGHPAEYEIRIEGELDPGWLEWFPGMRILREEDRAGCAETVLSGLVPDQSALRGILCKLWDLGLTVLRVEQRKSGMDERSKSS